MRKILSLFMAALLMFSIPAFADGSYGGIGITADKTEASGGDEVLLTISMNGMAALRGFQYTVQYDENIFEAVSSKTERISGAMANTVKISEAGKIGVAVAFKDETTYNGKIAEVVLRVKKSTADTNAVFKITGMKARTTGGDIENDTVFAVESMPEIRVTGGAVFDVAVNKTAVTTGEIVKYTFNIDNVEEFEGVQFDLKYDTDILKFESVDFGNIYNNATVGSYEAKDGGIITFIAGYDSEVTANGMFAEVSFKVLNTSKSKLELSIQKLKSTSNFKWRLPDVSVIGAESANKITLAADRTVVLPNGEVNISVNADIAATNGFEFVVADNPNFEFVGISDEANIAATVFECDKVESGVKFMYADTAKQAVKARLAVIKYRAKADAAGGETEFAVSGFKSPDLISTENVKVSIDTEAKPAEMILTADKASVAAGDTVKMEIGTKNLLNIKGISFELAIDEKVFDIVSITNAADNIFDTLDNNKLASGDIRFIGFRNTVYSEKDLTPICTVELKVKDVPVFGDTNIKIGNVKSDAVFTAKEYASNTISVFDNTKAGTITVKPSVKAAVYGDEIKVNLDYEATTAIRGMQFALKYDPTALEYVSAEKGDVMAGMGNVSDEEQGMVGIIYTYNDPELRSGKIAELSFKVKDGAPEGKTDFSVDGITGITNRVDVTIGGGVVIAEKNAEVRILADKESLNDGGELALNIEIKNLKNAYGVQYTLPVDTDVFEIISAENDLSAIFGTNEIEKKSNSVNVLIFNSGNKFDGDYTTTVIKLKVKNPVESKNVTFDFSKLDIASSASGYSIPFIKETAKVEIISNQSLADAVKAKIAEIGEVTLESEAAIVAAENAYAALTEEQKALVDNHDVLEAARAKYNKLVADKAAADAVKEKIAEIGEVTLESEAAIKAAEEAYAALTAEQKDLVDNHDVLEAARAKYDKLVADRNAAEAVKAKIAEIGEVNLGSEAAIVAAENAYAALTEEQKNLVDNYGTLTAARITYNKLVSDKAAAEAVKAKIAEIGEVTLGSEAAIVAAENAYAALTEEQKALVDNYDTLTAARITYNKLVSDKAAAEAVKAKIAEIGEVTLGSEAAIVAAENAYAALTEEQKALVDNYGVLTAAREAYNAKKAEKEKADKEAADTVKEKIAAIGKVTIDSEAAIKAAEEAYAALTDDQKKLVDNYDVLTAAREKYNNFAVVTFVYNSGTEDTKVVINKGEKVKQPETPYRSGYTFNGWYKDKELTERWDFEKTDVTENISIYADWKRKSSGGGGSSGGGSRGSGSKGSSSGITITNPQATGSNTGSGTTGNNKVTFKDIENHWAREDIEYLAGKAIIKGMDADTFAPDKPVTRAEFTQLIYNIVKPAKASASGFSDVNAGDWYCEAVASVAAAGIVKGYEDNTFRPNNTISRQEMACIISRMYDYKSLPKVTPKGLDGFTDKELIGDWAINDVDKIVSAGIMQGMSKTEFSPQTNATRAQAAVVIKAIYMLLNR